MDDAQRLLRDAEEQIEAWLCELDAKWTRILADARLDAARIIAAAQSRSTAMIVEAEARVSKAEIEASTLLAGSARLARMQLAQAEADAARARTLAAESRATAEAFAVAADAAATGQLESRDLAALAVAVVRLRTELSRVVDAAFDALPAVEATAAALQLDPAGADLPEAAPEPEPKPRRGLFRRRART